MYLGGPVYFFLLLFFNEVPYMRASFSFVLGASILLPCLLSLRTLGRPFPSLFCSFQRRVCVLRFSPRCHSTACVPHHSVLTKLSVRRRSPNFKPSYEHSVYDSLVPQCRRIRRKHSGMSRSVTKRWIIGVSLGNPCPKCSLVKF